MALQESTSSSTMASLLGLKPRISSNLGRPKWSQAVCGSPMSCAPLEPACYSCFPS